MQRPPIGSIPPIPLPDPPLADGVVRLRPWEVGSEGDAAALVAAWADPEIRQWTGVPPVARRTDAYAARWIAGEGERRELGLALDLVIGPAADDSDDRVLGEVGLGPIDWSAKRAAIGWWVAAEARGRGVATRGVALVARWAEATLDLRVYAEIDPANHASLVVAERAAIEVLISPS